LKSSTEEDEEEENSREDLQLEKDELCTIAISVRHVIERPARLKPDRKALAVILKEPNKKKT